MPTCVALRNTLSELCRCQCSCTWEHADGSLRPSRVAVTTPIDSPSACQHLGSCQHIDIGSETHERATATMLFLSVASRRVQSGPSNALHLQRKATSQSRGSGIDASKRNTKEYLCRAINKSSLRQGPPPVSATAVSGGDIGLVPQPDWVSNSRDPPKPGEHGCDPG